MEKPVYPSLNMRITQGYNEGTHKDSFAIDNAGKDTGIEKIIAPFTGIVKKIYTADANEVWIESVEQVEYPDGTIDYMTVMFAHANDVSDLFVGKKINQKEEFYSEGTKGNVTGNHCHMECGKGKFTGTGWYKNNSGYYSINNGKKPEECFWIDSSINIINNHNYSFKQVVENNVDPSSDAISDTDTASEPTPDPETTSDTAPDSDLIFTDNDKKIKLIYTCTKTDLYGIYLKENEKVYIEE